MTTTSNQGAAAESPRSGGGSPSSKKRGLRWNYPRKVNLYNDSRTGKLAARKNLEDDFASVIATALNQR